MSAIEGLPIECQGCHRVGPYEAARAWQRWCRCKRVGTLPMQHPPKGVVYSFRVDDAATAALHEEGRVLGNAFIAAKDALSGRWIRCGKTGWRELPRTSPKRRALETAFRKARKALDAFQAACPHPRASLFEETACDCCHAIVFEQARAS